MLLYLVIFTIGLLSCQPKNKASKQLNLDERYSQIETIHSLANCQSPTGNYTTEVKSFPDRTCYFKQIDEDRNLPFYAKLTSDNKGLLLDENEEVIDTLPSNAVEMIRGHDFHRIQTNPEQVFHKIKFEEKLGDNLERFSALDNLGNVVGIFYNRAEAHISKIELINPVGVSDVIEVIHKSWMDSKYGKLAKEIEIIQAKKDTFYFNFEYVKINEL